MQKITIVKSARTDRQDPPPRACTWVIEDFGTNSPAPQR
jgi:hypothetical protein